MSAIGEAREAMLVRLEAIFSRATHGSWRTYQDGVHPAEVGGINSGADYAICTHGPQSYQNADWIAAIHNDWPMVIELISELSGRQRSPQRPPVVNDDEDDHMVKISALISRLQSTLDQFGDTCVYIRRGGLAWGAVALNRRDDDKKRGVFELQAQHDRDLLQRAEQVQRLIASRNSAEERLNIALTALRRINSLAEKNVPNYAQEISREGLGGLVGGSGA